MREDLAKQTSPQTRDTEVAIIGAGIAGFILAKQLVERGIPCLLIESGSDEEQTVDPLYKEVDFRRRTYRGAVEGRSRCLGGTSVKWGGALLPFRERDFEPRDHAKMPDWPIRLSDLAPYLENAERLFGLDNSCYAAELNGIKASHAFLPREAKWPSFRKRNVTLLFPEIANAIYGLTVWLNATVREFDVREGSVRSVTALGPDGQLLTVRASRFVLCAGAIETTRLMLLLDMQTKGLTVTGREHLGRYFCDHLSLPLATIETKSPERLNQIFGFRFDGAVMRSLRFERDTAGEIAGFVHIAPRTEGSTGFDYLRNFMRSIQRRKPNLWEAMQALRHAPFLARLIWWRFFKKRLLWPVPAEYDVHFVIEQLTSAENRIGLGARVDPLGHQVAEIDWDVSKDDQQELDYFCSAFEKYWTESDLSGLGQLVWRSDPVDLDRMETTSFEGIYHPTGTTRMATCPAKGVVDKDLLVFGLNNLYIGSTSVFPNGGSANPTMTLILLILRLAAHLETKAPV